MDRFKKIVGQISPVEKATEVKTKIKQKEIKHNKQILTSIPYTELQKKMRLVEGKKLKIKDLLKQKT